MSTARVKWVEDRTFIGIDANGRGTVISSGEGPGISPMQMLLLGLGGCSLVDVVTILRKQRQPIVDVEVQVSGERGEEWPRPWKQIHMHYIITGDGLDTKRVERAIGLSVEKYCGAHATLSGVATITHDYEIRSPEGSGQGQPRG